MSYQLFPTKEYTIKSPLPVATAIEKLSDNVMERQAFTIDVLSAFLDGYLKLDRYFEGEIDDTSFNINHKQYTIRRGSFSTAILPMIVGKIELEGSQTVIYATGKPTGVIVFIMSQVFTLLLVFLDRNFLFISPVIVILSYFTHRYFYLRRLRKNIDRLINIFMATTDVQ